MTLYHDSTSYLTFLSPFNYKEGFTVTSFILTLWCGVFLLLFFIKMISALWWRVVSVLGTFSWVSHGFHATFKFDSVSSTVSRDFTLFSPHSWVFSCLQPGGFIQTDSWINGPLLAETSTLQPDKTQHTSPTMTVLFLQMHRAQLYSRKSFFYICVVYLGSVWVFCERYVSGHRQEKRLCTLCDLCCCSRGYCSVYPNISHNGT